MIIKNRTNFLFVFVQIGNLLENEITPRQLWQILQTTNHLIGGRCFTFYTPCPTCRIHT